MSSQLDRIESMLRALCAHLGVQAADRSGNGSYDVADSDGNRYSGVVSRFEHGWGFIECEAMNRNFFVHYSDIEGTGLRSLDAGEAVSFELAPGKDGRPKAVRVRRQSGRPSPRAVRSQGFTRNDPGSPAPSASALAAMRRPLGGAVQDGEHGLPADEPDEAAAPLEDHIPSADESRPGSQRPIEPG